MALALLMAASSGCGEGERTPVDPRLEFPPTARPAMLADLRAARDAPRHPADGQGSAELILEADEQATVQAGRRKAWKIRFTAGDAGIAPGGFVRLTVPRFWEWSPAQNRSPEYPGYTVATCSAEGVELETYVQGNFWIEWRVRGRALGAGESIEIVYGASAALAVADKFAEHGSQFWVSVDGDGDGVASLLAHSPVVDVLAGAPSRLVLVMASTAEPEEEITLHVSLLDRFGSAGTRFQGEVSLEAYPEGLEIPLSVTIGPDAGGALRVPIRVKMAGVYRILATASIGDVEIAGQSNPLLVEKNLARIRWGDLHGHSNLSDGTGTPDDFLNYARNIAGLDIVSLTDHDHWGMQFLDEHPELWEEIKATTLRHNEPGKFLAILGFEWTSWIHGHRHVLYFEDDGELLSSIDEKLENPAQLWGALRGQRALTFAHHSAGGPVATNWDYPPDPELEPVTEVASVHGNSEARDGPYPIYNPVQGNYVRNVLDRGFQLGFIGSGDSHNGHPGLADVGAPTGAGLAAILTQELTREGVRQALKQRRSYATNGKRIILRVALGGKPMGSLVEAGMGGSEPVLYIRAIGTAPLRSIEVIRNGRLVLGIDAAEEWELHTSVKLERLEEGDYIYVRVIQIDQGAAWSSPFFVGTD
jgi:hypothetical protein